MTHFEQGWLKPLLNLASCLKGRRALHPVDLSIADFQTMKCSAGYLLICSGLLFLLPLNLPAQEITGKAVYKHCKACHGARGEGGKDGKYPRLAGLPQAYLEQQLQDFKGQKRVNKPMIPIFKHVRFDAAVIETVAAYVAGMSKPDLSLWPYQASKQALDGFESKTVFAAAGQAAYQADCASCHGGKGQGGAQTGAPPLVNQYPAYLGKQMDDFAGGRRSHAHSENCAALPSGTREAVINYLVELGK